MQPLRPTLVFVRRLPVIPGNLHSLSWWGTTTIHGGGGGGEGGEEREGSSARKGERGRRTLQGGCPSSSMRCEEHRLVHALTSGRRATKPRWQPLPRERLHPGQLPAASRAGLPLPHAKKPSPETKHSCTGDGAQCATIAVQRYRNFTASFRTSTCYPRLRNIEMRGGRGGGRRN